VVALASIVGITVLIGLGVAITGENNRMKLQLAGMAMSIEHRAVQVNVRYWFESRLLARKIQGPIFTEVLGKLRKYTRPQVGPELGDLGTTLGRHRFVARLSQLLTEPRLMAEPKTAIDGIAESWSDFYKLRPTTLAPDAKRILLTDLATCEAVVELAREAITLGVENARTTAAQVEIDLAEDDCIVVRVTDNGVWNQNPKQLLDTSRHVLECTMAYFAKRSEAGAEFEFRVPVLR
jgi:hypothetical protein